MNKFEEFKKAYDDYPCQDNEGFWPDRAGFKCGFSAAWALLEKKLGPEFDERITRLESYLAQVEEENAKLRKMWELRQGSPTRERYKQIVNKLKVQYHEKEALKGEVTKLKELLARAYEVCGPMQWGTLRHDIREVLEND